MVLNTINMKLFGRDLFSFKKEPEFMYDFASHGLVNRGFGLIGTGVTANNPVTWVNSDGSVGGNTTPQPPKKEKPKKTPKELWKANALNDNQFAIQVDEAYLTEQIDLIKEKLRLMGKKRGVKFNPNEVVQRFDSSEHAGVTYGREELESILERIENRRRIKEVQSTVDRYPHTSTKLVRQLIKDNNHLLCDRGERYVPDFPKDAVKAMKEYEDMCIKLCNKKPIFYVIAESEDFEEVNKRRDPILLAQSPFGFFWQILGAWDEEIQLLEDL